MAMNFQSRIIKPRPMTPNPRFESAQMQNPGKPISITWKFGDPLAKQTATPMSSRITPPTRPADSYQRETPPATNGHTPPEEPYRRKYQPPVDGGGRDTLPEEPYERPDTPPPDEPRLDFQEPLDTAALTESALAPLWDKYKRARELAQSALSARGMGRSGALLGHENLGEEALFRSFVSEAGAITSHFALEAAKLGLSQQQIALAERELALKEKSEGELLDWEKDRFAKQMAENSRQFNREFSLKETMAMDTAKQEWAKIGLSQQEIDERSRQFNESLLWQQEQFGMTFSWEQTKWLDQMAFSYVQLEQQGAISYLQMENDMTQFYATLKQNLYIADKQLAIDQWMAQLSQNKIFGYFDPGYGPGEENAFTGEKLEWNATLGQWVQTKEYAKFLADYYHKGELDLTEMEIIIRGILGLTGSSNEEETGDTTPPPPSISDRWTWGNTKFNEFREQHPNVTDRQINDALFVFWQASHGPRRTATWPPTWEEWLAYWGEG